MQNLLNKQIPPGLLNQGGNTTNKYYFLSRGLNPLQLLEPEDLITRNYVHLLVLSQGD